MSTLQIGISQKVIQQSENLYGISLREKTYNEMKQLDILSEEWSDKFQTLLNLLPN